jgi:hypothetical protein
VDYECRNDDSPHHDAGQLDSIFGAKLVLSRIEAYFYLWIHSDGLSLSIRVWHQKCRQRYIVVRYNAHWLLFGKNTRMTVYLRD